MEYLKKVLEITTLAMTYQELGLGTAFVSYSGHTEQLDIRLYKGCWTGTDCNQKIESITFYFNEQNFNYKKYLKTIIWLQDCLIKKELQSSDFIKIEQETNSEIF